MKFLLSDDQINLFRDGMTVRTEHKAWGKASLLQGRRI